LSYTHFNQEKLEEHFAGNKDILQAVYVELERTNQNILSKIETSIKENNFVELERNAHSLKGALSNFFAEECVKIAYKLECMGHNQAIDGAIEALESLRSAIVNFSRDLDDYLKSA